MGFVQNAKTLQDRIESKVNLSDKAIVVISSWVVTVAHISFAGRMVFGMMDFYVLYGGAVGLMIGPMVVFVVYKRYGGNR